MGWLRLGWRDKCIASYLCNMCVWTRLGHKFSEATGRDTTHFHQVRPFLYVLYILQIRYDDLAGSEELSSFWQLVVIDVTLSRRFALISASDLILLTCPTMNNHFSIAKGVYILFCSKLIERCQYSLLEEKLFHNFKNFLLFCFNAKV